MENTQTKKVYNLGERTSGFASEVFKYVNELPKSTVNNEIGKQVVRSAGSVGANYIEAEDSLGKKDFYLHMKISRKEAKETTYWLRLSEPGTTLSDKKRSLIQESIELMNIFGAIVQKSR